MLATARPSCYHIVLALIYCCCAGAAIFLQKFLQTFRATVSFYFTCANGVSNIRTYSSDPFRVWSRCRFSVFVIVNCVDTSSATGSARTHAHTHTHTRKLALRVGRPERRLAAVQPASTTNTFIATQCPVKLKFHATDTDTDFTDAPIV